MQSVTVALSKTDLIHQYLNIFLYRSEAASGEQYCRVCWAIS